MTNTSYEFYQSIVLPSCTIQPEEKRPLGRPRRKLEDNIDNIKMDLQEVGWGGLDWIDLAQGRGRWWTLVNVVLDFWVP
jgi:hypothetical protein